MTYYPNIRRSTRQNAGIAPTWFGFSNICLVTEAMTTLNIIGASFRYEQAMKTRGNQEWTKEMGQEFDSLSDCNVRTLVPFPCNRKAVKTKWVYDVKYEGKDRLIRCKARTVSKGFPQKAGVDYLEGFDPIFRYTTTRLSIALNVYYNWNRVQLDVKTEFLNAELDEEIYILKPSGLVINGKVKHVYLSRKALYGFNRLQYNGINSWKAFWWHGTYCILADPALFYK